MRSLIASRKRWRLLGASVFLALAAACVEADETRTLVIAGGAVSPDNATIYEAFIDAMADPSGDRVAVISAASGSPVESMLRTVDTLGRYGIEPARVSHVHIAVMDDASTPDVDERRWAANAGNAEEIAKIEQAGAIWFAGGDQLRLTTVLLDKDGGPTPMLKALRRRLNAGAAIGGTSAGAAIMSDPMIARGHSLAALLRDDSVGEALQVADGLGFFPHGLVDQHFDANARLGRMAVALGRLEESQRLGFGIDEDTALVYVLGEKSLTVAGSGNLTVIDGRQARWQETEGGVRIQGLVISVLSPGDTISVDGGEFAPSAYLAPTIGNEYRNAEPVQGGGIALPAMRLADLLGEELLDNVGASMVDRYSFAVTGADVLAVRFRFTQMPDSAGYWGNDDQGRSRYSVFGVRLDIEPVGMQLR